MKGVLKKLGFVNLLINIDIFGQCKEERRMVAICPVYKYNIMLLNVTNLNNEYNNLNVNSIYPESRQKSETDLELLIGMFHCVVEIIQIQAKPLYKTIIFYD